MTTVIILQAGAGNIEIMEIRALMTETMYIISREVRTQNLIFKKLYTMCLLVLNLYVKHALKVSLVIVMHFIDEVKLEMSKVNVNC